MGTSWAEKCHIRKYCKVWYIQRGVYMHVTFYVSILFEVVFIFEVWIIFEVVIIVKTPTQQQLNINSTEVGFDMKIALYISPP